MTMKAVILATITLLLCESTTLSFSTPSFVVRSHSLQVGRKAAALKANKEKESSLDDNKPSTAAPTKTPPPVLNGRMVLPFSVVSKGLEGHTVYGVYAILNGGFQRGSNSDGWQHAEYIGLSNDIRQSIQGYLDSNEEADSRSLHVRALSFSFPQQAAMQEIANEWIGKAQAAGAPLSGTPSEYDLRQQQMALMEATAFFDDDDDEDDWDEDDGVVQSPFAKQPADDKDSSSSSSVMEPTMPSYASTAAESSETEFTLESVDKVLDEIRPYLINDGGNVSVERVVPETKDVYLRLEGACGSCPSSTVTMQMGIERVLKENFSDLGQVVKVDDDNDGEPKGLTVEAVEEEVSRISAAIIAMGGVVRIEEVDTETGVVKINFRGGSKVKQGLELALLDIPHVKHVEFVTPQ